MTIRLNAFDSLTSGLVAYDLEWDAFVDWVLRTHVETPAKASVPLYNLMSFTGTRRLKSAATGCRAIVLDIEHLSAEDLKDVYERLMPYECVWFTTHSYTYEDARCRCNILLDRDATVQEYEATWTSLQALIGKALDPACKDASHAYFIPSHAPGRVYGATYNPGKPYPVCGHAPVGTSTPAPLRDILEGEIRAVVKKEARTGKPSAILIKDRVWAHMPLADVGDRDNAMWRLAVWYVRHWPDGRADSLVSMCAGSIAAMNDPTFTDATLADKVERARADMATQAETGIQLLCNNQGTPIPGQENISRVLTQDPTLAGKFRLNTFANRVECTDLPFDQEVEGQLRDTDTTKLQCYLEQKYRLNVKPTQAWAGIMAAASINAFNPVQDYLNALVWDGTPRLDTWLETYAGVDPDPLTQRMGARWLLSAVARALSPTPTKVDHVLILYGETDLGKSSVLKALFGGDTRGWFSDQLSALDHKDSAQDLPGKWCIEWAELSTFKRASNDAVKAFVTRTVDHYRPSHGRNTVDIMRRGVFCATTNEEEFLYDPTGNRRYWVVNVRKWCDVAGMLDMRDHIWAEAKVRYQAGEQWWPERGEAAEIAAATEMYRVEDTWEETIREWFLNTPPTPVQNLSAKWFLYTVIGLTPDKCNRAHEMRITAVLKKLGFAKVFVGPNRNLKRWQPPATLQGKIAPGQLALVK